MTTHERWVVYPLVFLALGIAMRDKFVGGHTRHKAIASQEIVANEIHCNKATASQEIVANEIRCNKLRIGQLEGPLVVTGPNGVDAVRMGVVPDGGGRLEICSSSGETVVTAGTDQTGQAGLVQTLDDKGTPQVQLLSTPSGGIVTTVRHDRKVWVVTGHLPGFFGVFAEVPHLGRRLPLTWPLKVDTRPKPTPSPAAPPKDPDDQPAGP